MELKGSVNKELILIIFAHLRCWMCGLRVWHGLRVYGGLCESMRVCGVCPGLYEALSGSVWVVLAICQDWFRLTVAYSVLSFTFACVPPLLRPAGSVAIVTCSVSPVHPHCVEALSLLLFMVTRSPSAWVLLPGWCFQCRLWFRYELWSCPGCSFLCLLPL